MNRPFPIRLQPRADKTAVIYWTVIAAIIIALSPALFFSFGYHNDFNAWAYDTHSCCTHHPETLILLAIGRYFGAFAQNLQFWTIHGLADLWRWRLLGIFSTALLAAYYLHVVSLRRPPTWQNAGLTVAVFTLPTMQFQSIWVSMYTFWTPPILLSLMAAQLLLKAAEGDFLANRFATRRAVRLVFQAFAALLAGVFFYPISATFILVPAAHLLLNEKQYPRRIRRMAALATAVLCGAFIALFVIHKFFVLPHLSDVPYLGDYQFDFTADIVTDAAQRLRTYLLEGAFLWLGLDLPGFLELIALAAAMGAIWCAIRVFRGSITTSELLNLLMVCSLFVVAAGPLLIVHQFTMTYRIMFTMTAIELLVLFWLLKQVLPLNALTLASAFAAVGVVCAFVSVYGTAASAHAEYAIDARVVAGLPPRQFHPLVILRRNSPRTAFGFDLRNDFGALPPTYIFDLLIGPRYKGQPSFDVETVVLNQDDSSSLILEKNATTIDLSSIYGLAQVTDFSQFAIVSAQPRGVTGPINAVDDRADTFWEVCEQPFPIELAVDYPAARTLLGYQLSTFEMPEQMPSKWEIWITSDGRGWQRLQEVADIEPWNVREVRQFDVAPTPEVTGIKLVILANRLDRCMRVYEFRPIFETPAGRDQEPFK